MTQEFHISITPVGQQYLVRTEQVVPGGPVVEALVTLPLADWLIQTDQLINDAINAVLQSDEIVVESGLHPLLPIQIKIINLGQELYKALFQSPLKDSWITAQEIAQKKQEVLQLRLKLNEPLLALLPWEILHTGDCFLADEPSIKFSQSQVALTSMVQNRGDIGLPIPALQQSTMMLMAITMPNPQASFALKQEAIKLQAERQLPQTARLLNESALVTVTLGASSVGTGETPAEEEAISDFVAAMQLDEAAWDEGVDVGDDDPTYEEDSALVSDLFRQATQPTLPESPIAPTATLNQLTEVASSKPESLYSEVPQTTTHQSNKLEESTPAATDTPTRRSLKSGFPDYLSVQKFVPVLHAVGITAIALVGFWWLHREPQQPNPQLSPSQLAAVNLKTASSLELQAIAIADFNNGNSKTGCLVVEELLNRGALQSANTALSTVSDVQAKTSTVNFLQGRLAWQSIKVGDKNYSLDDVRSHWETAVKSNPASPNHHNALGFVYYMQGNLNRANQTWFQALYLVKEQQTKTATSTLTSQRDELNAYAGLALVLSKSAENQPNDKQAKLLSEAINLRQKVLTNEPINFQPQKLSKTWLWTEQAIQDWRSLLKLKEG